MALHRKDKDRQSRMQGCVRKAICPLAARWPIEYDHLIYNSVQSIKRFLYAKNNRLGMNILTTMGCVQKHHLITLGCHSIFVYV